MHSIESLLRRLLLVQLVFFRAASLTMSTVLPSASQYARIFGQARDVTEASCFYDSSACDDDGNDGSTPVLEIDVGVSVRDVDEDRGRKFVHHLRYDHSRSAEGRKGAWARGARLPQELPKEVSYVGHSPSGRRSVRVVKVKDKTCVEVWEGSALLARCSGEDLHEGVSAGGTGQLSGLAWSMDEQQVVYVAERVPDKHHANFFQPLSAKALVSDSSSDEKELAAANKEAEGRGRVFDLRDDWGEKLGGSDRLALFRLDVTRGVIEELPGSTCGGEVTPGQPCISADGTAVVFVAYPHAPKKLGLVYCFQRPCSLRRVPLPAAGVSSKSDADASDASDVKGADSSAESFEVLTPFDRVAFSPRMSPKRDQLAYLGSTKGFDTHVGPLAIKLLALTPDGRLADPKTAPRELVPPSPPSQGPALDAQAPGGFQFPGYWWPSSLPLACWTSSGKHLWFTSLWGSRPTAMRVQIDNGRLQRVAPEAMRASSSSTSSSISSSSSVGPQQDGSVVVLSALPQCPSSSAGSGSDSNSAFEDGEGAVVAWSTPAEPGGVAVVNFHQNGNDNADQSAGSSSSSSGTVSSSGQVASCAPIFGKQMVTSAPLNGPPATSSAAASSDAASATSSSSSPLGLSWRMVSVVPPDSATGVPIEGVLILPPPQSSSSSKPLGLIAVPHGGPHSATPTSFVAPYAYLAIDTNCAVLHLNYRGSIGYGTPDLNSLPGRIGTQDVEDCVLLTQHVLKNAGQSSKESGEVEIPTMDSDRVVVVGGSHGGFLGAHLSAQHPEIFKVAALRNPVTNLPAMASVTDIPDWCGVETLGVAGAVAGSEIESGVSSYDFDGPFGPAALSSVESLAAMWDKSPTKYLNQVRAPTLLAIGAKDKRVPCSQGVEWHHALKARGIPTRLLMYPEDSHPIDKPVSEADHWINVVHWINEHLG